MFNHQEFQKHSLNKDVWDIPWVKDAFNEDNDTSDDDSSQSYESEYDDEEEHLCKSTNFYPKFE